MIANRLTKLATVLTLFILFACENQEILQLEEETQTTESSINLESFQIKEIPDLANEINNLTKSSNVGWTSRSKGDNIVLDESRILAVTDSVGNTSFSIRMYVPETPYNVFHNLVFKQTPDGKMNEPIVLRYEVKEDYWFTYISSERGDAPFYGNLEVFSISSINELGSKTNRDGAGDQPCYTYSSDNGSSSSGSGSSGSGGGTSNSNSNSGTQGGFSSTGIVWSKGGGYVEVGEGFFGRPAPDDSDTKKSYSAKNGECPEDEMLVPINERLPWENIIIESEGEKIDPEEELKCFDKNKSGKITIYVQQPNENTDDIMGKNQVGHVFVGLEQNGIRKHFGFYPPENASDLGIGVGNTYDSELRNNEETLYHVSISKEIDAKQMNEILNYAKNYPEKYQLKKYACTEFGIEMGNLAGLNLPKTTVTDPDTGGLLFRGRSQGKLGQEIRAMRSDSKKKVVKSKGKSPSNSKEKC